MLLAIAFVVFLTLIVAWLMAPSSIIDDVPAPRAERTEGLAPAIHM